MLVHSRVLDSLHFLKTLPPSVVHRKYTTNVIIDSFSVVNTWWKLRKQTPPVAVDVHGTNGRIDSNHPTNFTSHSCEILGWKGDDGPGLTMSSNSHHALTTLQSAPSVRNQDSCWLI